MGTLRYLQKVQRGLQLLPRGGEVLEEFHFPIKVNDKGLVLVDAQHLIEKGGAGVALLAENTPLAEAGIHQKAEGQRKIRLMREVANGLRAVIFFQLEI